MYLDRGVYRPGSIINLSAIIRDKTNQSIADNVPIKLIVKNPKISKSLKSFHFLRKNGKSKYYGQNN